jgi:transposase InsO family protein
MENVTIYKHALALRGSGMRVPAIAALLGKDRATIYRWFHGVRYQGLCEFERRKRECKRRRRRRSLDAVTTKLILKIRREYGWCGQKIRFWLRKEYGKNVGLSSVYRTLNKHFVLRKKWKKNDYTRGKVPKAAKRRDVGESDTVDLGELFAYTTIDTFTREADVQVGVSLAASEGQRCIRSTAARLGGFVIWQSDGGPEFKAECHQEILLHSKRHRYARAYKKNEQAHIESFNRTLRKQCTGHHKYRKQDKQLLEEQIRKFLHLYNDVQPHLSLSMMSPSQFAHQLSHL